MRVAMCLPAYNEGGNLKHLLPRLVGEKLLHEIIVVASGCTDDTIEVAESFAPRVQVLVQDKREGKSSAINLFLAHTDADIIVMESTDTIPALDCISIMLQQFSSPLVGMVGAHPTPINSRTTVIGLAASILWGGHHRLALHKPKLGEMVAWRNVLSSIPGTSSVDEAAIEAAIANLGLQLIYEPQAIVFNKGPERVADLIKQRKRIYLGHLRLHDQGYRVSSMGTITTLRMVIAEAPKTPKGLLALGLLCSIEAYSRFAAQRLYRHQAPEQTIWDVAETTKNLRDKA